MLGQISESTNIAIEGFQYFKKFFIIKLLSIGKNWWITFLSLKFEINFAELRVLDVINICVTFFSSYFFINGIML